jgi:hypothetical protein
VAAAQDVVDVSEVAMNSKGVADIMTDDGMQTDEERLRRGLSRAETVAPAERWRPVSAADAPDGPRVAAGWRPDAEGGARWELRECAGGPNESPELCLVPVSDDSISQAAMASVAESWTFGRTCLEIDATAEGESLRRRWRSGRWPAEVSAGHCEQLELLRGQLVSLVQEDADSARIARLRASIERVVVELYGLQIDELVGLESARRDR